MTKVVDSKLKVEDKFGPLGKPTTLVVHHGDSARDSSDTNALEIVRRWHADHARQGWGGIGYHFAVTSRGTLIKLRPVGLRGAHVYKGNTGRIGVVLIGSYDKRHAPNAAQIQTLRWLYHHGSSVGVPRGLLLGGHRDYVNTDCPGDRLYAVLPRVRATSGPAPAKRGWRNLSITEPLTEGDDVEELQEAIGRQIDRMGLDDFGIEKPTVDKVMGRDTLVKARAVGRELGAPDAQLTGPIRPHLQKIIRAPWRRTPAEVARGVRRMAQRRARRKRRLSGSTRPGPPGWGGSRGVLEETLDNARRAGAPLTSTKRYRVISGSSRSSDHDWRNLRAYAHDYGTFNGAGLARSIGRELGCPFDPVGTYQRFTVYRDGRAYSVQILWAVANHFNHVHVGAHRV